MADPLSIAASIIAVIGAAKAVSLGLNELRLCLGASDELLQLINEVTDIRSVLHKLDLVCSEAVQVGLDADQALDGLKPLVQRTKKTLLELANLIDRLSLGGLDPTQPSKLSKVAWIRHNRKARDFANQLQGCRTSILTHITIIPIFQQFKAYQDIQSIQATSNRILQLLEPQFSPSHVANSQQSTTAQASSSLCHRPPKNALVPADLESLDIETLSWSKPCSTSCKCQCHLVSSLETPRFFRGFLGALFVRYSGIPRFGTRQCSIASCNRGISSISLTYMFPAKLVRGLLGFSAIWQGMTRIEAALNIPNVVEDSYGIWDIIEKDNASLLWKLFQIRDFSPTDVSVDGETYLHYAIQRKSFSTIKLLLNYGLDIHAPDHDNRTPVRLAWQLARRELSDEDQRTLSRLRIDDEDVVNSFGFTLVHKIVLGIRSRNLLDEPDEVKPSLEIADRHGWTPLHWAASNGDDEITAKLITLEAGLDHVNNRGEAALHLAIAQGHIHCAQLLVDAGACVFATTPQLDTPLHYAAANPDLLPAVIHLLIDRGCDIEATDEVGSTPLCEAARCNNLQGVQALIAHGANLNHLNKNRSTPVSSAIAYNAIETAECLCNLGADLTTVNIWGYNIFHQIAYGAGIEIINMLKDVSLEGVDPDLVDEEGVSPLEAFTEWRDTNFAGERGEEEGELAAFRLLLDKARSDSQHPARADETVNLEVQGVSE